MKKVLMTLAAAGFVLTAVPATAAVPNDPAAEEALKDLPPEQRQKVIDFEQSLHPATGVIKVPGGKATLDLGDRFYFLPAEDAKRVLVESWGNPPDSVGDVLGMVFPKGAHFYDGSWGAVLSYEDTGHVEDKDASSQDYDAVLEQMKTSANEENEARKSAGYGGLHIVGWAQAPTYDRADKTLIWARDIKFDGEKSDTLNYDVRKLARTGVLSMNMVSSMDRLEEVKDAASSLGSTVQFDAGSRYADYDSSVDHTADYGLAGLVAAGAGVAVAKKAGLLGILLIVLKKAFVFILAAAAGVIAWVKRKLGMAPDEAEEDYSYEAPESDAAAEPLPDALPETAANDPSSETGATG